MSELGEIFLSAVGGESALAWGLRLLLAAILVWLSLRWLLHCRYRRERLRLWWLVLRCYSPPWFGMVRRLARQELRPRELAPGEHWSESELRICEKFADLRRSSGVLNPQHYNNARSYLRKVGEAGRSEMGWRWIGIVGLFFAEATIMAKVISGYTLPGASEAVQWNAALLIGGLLTLVLLVLTHLSGRELHLRSLVKLARKEWRERNHRDDSIRPRDMRSIEIDEDSYDDGHAIYHQMARRLKGNAKFTPGIAWRTIFCAVFIVIVTGAGYTIRLATYEQERRDYEQLRLADAREAAGGLIEDSPEAPLAAAPPAAPDPLAAAPAQPPDIWAHRVTYGVLGVLFLALQWIAILMARHYGFSGIRSAAAARVTRRFTTMDDYRNWLQTHKAQVERRAVGALDKLQDLQQRREIREGVGQDSGGWLAPRAQRNFSRYLELLEPAPAQAAAAPAPAATAPAPAALQPAVPAPLAAARFTVVESAQPTRSSGGGAE